MEILFLLSFTLHNIEEGLWLPAWSKYAGKYHPKVEKNEFHFALFVVTTFGYLLTFLNLRLGREYMQLRYIYLGFVAMMVFNAILPHLVATIVLMRYAPGTITGLLLNLPIGLSILMDSLNSGIQPIGLILSIAGVAIATLSSLKLLFKIGGALIDQY